MNDSAELLFTLTENYLRRHYVHELLGEEHYQILMRFILTDLAMQAVLATAQVA